MNPIVQPLKWLWLPSQFFKSLHNFFTGFKVVKQQKIKNMQCIYNVTEARSRNGRYRGEAITIIYSKCVCVCVLCVCVCVFLPQVSGNQSACAVLYRVIHKSLRDFRTRLRNNQDRHGRKKHINRKRISPCFFRTRGLGVLPGSTARG